MFLFPLRQCSHFFVKFVTRLCCQICKAKFVLTEYKILHMRGSRIYALDKLPIRDTVYMSPE